MTTIAPIEQAIAAERQAAEQECLEYARRRVTGEDVPLAEIKPALQQAEWTAEKFDALEAALRNRAPQAALAARLDTLRESLAEVELQRQNEVAEHERRLAEIDGDAASFREDIKDAETARRQLLKTARDVCPPLASKRREVDRLMQRWQRILAEPLPTLDAQPWQFQPTADMREHVARQVEDLQAGQREAEAAIAVLQPLSDALKQLALTAMPTVEQMQTVLDQHREAQGWL
jgi:hypothetical protein